MNIISASDGEIRLRIVGATVTAAGGAFMGHVGAEAGRQAVNAVFD